MQIKGKDAKCKHENKIYDYNLLAFIRCSDCNADIDLIHLDLLNERKKCFKEGRKAGIEECLKEIEEIKEGFDKASVPSENYFDQGYGRCLEDVLDNLKNLLKGDEGK